MPRSNEQFDTSIDQFLNEFELRKPRALPSATSSVPAWRRVAAAAGVLVSFGVSMWLLLRNPAAPSAVSSAVANESEQHGRSSSIALVRLAFGDPARFDAELAEASRKSLPNFQRADSALQVLTKE
jgi:hypothetical protein